MASRLHSPAAILRYWRRYHPNDPIILSLAAVVIGLVVAYAAIGFRLALQGVQFVAFGFAGENVISQVAELAWWHILLVPTVGGLLIGLVIHFFMPGRRPQGVADVIEAGAMKGGRMRFGEGIGAAAVSAASLGVGASAGREGPVVHLGGVLGSFAAQRLQLNPAMRLTLLGCGVASAVAASFNAPIAGVFFALEVVIGHYALHAFAPVVLASVVGTVVSRLHLGDLPAFIIPDYAIVSILEVPGFLLLGLVCGVNAMIFMWSIMVADQTCERLRLPVFVRPAAGGFAVGLIAIFLPQVLGVGYEATDAALKQQLPLLLLIGLIVAKTAATAISLGCRFGGGVFSPSLFIGAMTGGAYGIIAASVFPELAAGHGLYAIVGMGATAAAVLGAPISTILIVFELTGDYRVTIAVMLAAVLATFMTQRIVGRSFFHWQLQRRGIDLRGGRPRHLLAERQVRNVMSRNFETVPHRAGLVEMKRLLLNSPHDAFFVIDDDERLVGTLTFDDLRLVAREQGLDDLVNARDVCRPCPIVLLARQTLDAVLSHLDSTGDEHLAVVHQLDNMRVVGVVQRKDVVLAHNRALLQAHAEEHD